MRYRLGAAFLCPLLWMGAASPALFGQQGSVAGNNISHVLLISIDGMHALDLANCVRGVGGTAGTPTCPNLALLQQTSVTYLQASTSKPSDSFPGLTALITGGSPRTAGLFYDVAYDRALSPPAQTTPYGITGGANLCPSVVGTQVGFDEQIDNDLTKLDGGGGINPNYLPRDPANGCAPVYPHSFLRVNTIFEVVKAGGGYTAWSDKHPAYDFPNGPSGKGVIDLWSPEINSNVVPLPSVPGCSPLPDQEAASGVWTDSHANIKCYDQLKVQAIINQIDGKLHDGSVAAPVPSIFGMNFQAVSVGQKLVEGGVAGGYLDGYGTPSPALLGEIQFVDNQIGKFVSELKKQNLYNSTLILITAKHGQSPININTLVRIPADNKTLTSPSDVLGSVVAQASEDDVSLIWLADQSKTNTAVGMLQANLAQVGGGEIFAGESLKLIFNDPATDTRSPDILITPNIGVVYTGGKKKVSEHGGFAEDDTHVIMLATNPGITAQTWAFPVRTAQIAPTVVAALGLNPQSLQAVAKEGTPVLPLLGLGNSIGLTPPTVLVKPVADQIVKSVTLDASGSSDPGGLAITYIWSNPTNNASISGANTATPTVQLVGGKGQYVFAVTVTNSKGASAVGTVTFNYVGQ